MVAPREGGHCHVDAASSNGGGRTVLQAAAEEGNLEVVEWPLQVKADVNAAASYRGWTGVQISSRGRPSGGC